MAVTTCACPPEATIPSLSNEDCEAKIGQIGKIAFQKLGQAFTTIGNQAEWDAALAASDDTKVTILGTLHGQETTPAEPITVGSAGSNDVFDGNVKNIGEGFYQISFNLRNPSPTLLAELKEYECEINRTGVYFMGSGFILSTGTSSAIPITSFFVQSSPALNGNTDDNLAQVIVNLDANWYANSLITSGDDLNFNPMLALVNP
ncbi:MAG: hypothetical protein ACXABD_16055 [Candidatus Thorarchaeota archaeon]|jgi:hypothetical protein